GPLFALAGDEEGRIAMAVLPREGDCSGGSGRRGGVGSGGSGSAGQPQLRVVQWHDASVNRIKLLPGGIGFVSAGDDGVVIVAESLERWSDGDSGRGRGSG
ncbi:unnamed protein product, partial [Phaeothamnion confervicola]